VGHANAAGRPDGAGDPPTRALLVFRSADRGAAEAFAQAEAEVDRGQVPGARAEGQRSQGRSMMAEGHRRRRRAASLTPASTLACSADRGVQAACGTGGLH